MLYNLNGNIFDMVDTSNERIILHDYIDEFENRGEYWRIVGRLDTEYITGGRVAFEKLLDSYGFSEELKYYIRETTILKPNDGTDLFKKCVEKYEAND